MSKSKRAQYTLEFKIEAVRLAGGVAGAGGGRLDAA